MTVEFAKAVEEKQAATRFPGGPVPSLMDRVAGLQQRTSRAATGVRVRSNAELADRAERIDAEIAKVRGRAQTTDGSVILETNPYGSITNLHLSSHVTSVEPSRLAAVITELHRRAYEEAKALGADVFLAIRDRATPTPAGVPPSPSDQWEDVTPIRYTSSI
ncbi:hypothetical protein ABZ412_29345 [Nocardia sp. NPDC005746]|uniref:hypothetical protein n=1 Tax=Nocardia sp. NPDC005746 TaxID=3157062 RepID=UPI0033EA2EB6